MKTFAEFWPFYLGEHSKPVTRRLHFVGSSAGIVCAAVAIVTRRWEPLVAALLVGYAFAWVGHFFVEGNKPATFKHPLWSFIADWKMWGLMLTGQLSSELSRHVKARA